MYLLCERYK